ncbi:MAG: hypothetical protein Q4B48_07030 [Syntrophomonadaceae bacterium]|nr:hypothetical protein [Syntrophomonadaceae bacterium]
MKLYYVCECCDRVYRQQENGTADGAMGIAGICPECAAEIGSRGETFQQNHGPVVYQ